MTLLTTMMATSASGGGGGGATIGEIRQFLTANALTGTQSNTITEATGNGVWIRANAVYQINTYPELFARLGYVNAQIGLTKTLPITGLAPVVGYSPIDDLYVFPYSASFALANSSLTNFVYKSGMGGGVYGMAYGGDGGNSRMVLVGPSGIAQFYTSNQTLTSTNTTFTNRTNVLSTNGNTFIAWQQYGAGNTIVISTNSGATFAQANVVNSNVYLIQDIAWGNIANPNGTYIIAPYSTFQSKTWVEASTDGIRWTGLPASDYVNRLPKTFGIGTANIYLATFQDANNSANTYVSRSYTSTDGLYWEYRGLIPASSTSSNSPNQAGQRITAAGNGANTVIAATDYFFTSSHAANYGHYIYNSHHGCHGHWTTHNWFNGDHHYYFTCGEEQQHTYGIVSYHYTSSSAAYGRIYTANATVTNTAALNIYAASQAIPAAHNGHLVQAFAYGNVVSAGTPVEHYVYSTDQGYIGKSTNGYTWSAVLNLSGPIPRAIIYGNANSTNQMMLLCNTGAIRTTTNIDNWTIRTTAYSLDSGIAGGWGTGAFGTVNGTPLFILGGNSGNVCISNDGIQFSGMNSVANAYSTAFGNSKFVAGMANGVLKYSFDGIYWNNTGTSNSNTSIDILAIASDGAKFVYTGLQGRTAYLYDVTGGWTNCTITTSNEHYAMVYGGGKWLMGGKDGSMFTSTDGITWTFTSSNTTDTILSLMYANNTYFYGGDNVLATSTDAVTWIRRTPDVNTNYVRISSLAYGNGYYVYGGQGFYGRSTDGITWRRTQPIGSLYLPNGNVALSNTMAANSQYFGQVTDMYYNANVTNTFISVGTNGFAATSPDGNVWTLANTKTNADFYSMAFGNGRVLAVGTTGTAKISPNGVLWSGHASNVNVFSIAYYANSVNSFVMVGASRAQNTLFGQMNVNVAWSGGVSNTAYTYVLETSNDGIYWTTQQWKTATYPGFAAGGNVSAIIMEAPVLGANTPGHLVATSTPNRNTSGRTSVSNNLTTWSGLGMTSAYGNTDLHLEKIVPATINISFANGSFYATGNTGIVARSNDGIYWTTSNVLDQFSNTAQYQSAIPAATAFGGMYKLVYHPASSTYVLPHAHGVLISKDAVTWNVRPNMYPNANTHTNQFNVDGPLMLYIANTSAIQYTNNWYNFISASYDTTSEFYVPGIAWRGGTAWYTYYNGQVGQAYLQTPGTWDFGGPYVAQSQTFGMTPELLFYVKAKN